MNTVILLLLILIAAFIVVAALGKSYHTKRYIGRNTGKWMFGTYCTVLLISVVVLYLIPEKGFLYPEEDFSNQSGQQKYVARERVDILKAAQENRLNQTEGIFLLGEKNFAFQGEKLEISLKSGYSNIPVIVKRKEQSDGKIEAVYFTTKTIGNNIDLSDKIKLPEMELLGNHLIVINPDNEIKMIEFRKDFIVAQFSDSTSRQPDNGLYLEWGQKVLYLQIPQNVQIKARQLDVQYVGE